MPLIDVTGLARDRWQRVDADAPLPAKGPVIVPPERLADVPEGREAGLQVGPEPDIEALVRLFPRLALISVEFPSFADGRGFSVGRCLRVRGFEGCLRAFGPVIADQFAYLLACGFDEAEIPDDLAARQPVEQWLAARRRFSAGYQRGLGAGQSILDARQDR